MFPFFRVMQRCLCSRYFRWKGFLSWFLVDPFVTSGVLKLYYLLLPLARSQNLMCILCFQLQSVLYFPLPQSDQLTVTPDSAAPRVYPDMVFVICHEKSVYIWYMYVPFFRVMQRCLCSGYFRSGFLSKWFGQSVGPLVVVSLRLYYLLLTLYHSQILHYTPPRPCGPLGYPDSLRVVCLVAVHVVASVVMTNLIG